MARCHHDGRILAVRKAGTSRFMLPDGKREAGESAVDAEIAELRRLDPAERLPHDLAPLLEHHVLRAMATMQ